MELSVVVPTLNGRDRLSACLDALAERVRPYVDSEVIVVNGPSVDGTTGMVRDRPDVDVLVEVDERNLNVARNAGIDRTSGDIVALVDHTLTVEDGWLDALRATLDVPGRAHWESGHGPDPSLPAAVTGPTREPLRGGMTTETVERRTIAGRTVTYLNGGNVAFVREALEVVDGFDEYLLTGGARDIAHRLAAAGSTVAWEPGLSVRREPASADAPESSRPVRSDGGRAERDWYWRYRSLTYRLVKNYGLRPTSLYRIGRHALGDASDLLGDVARGNASPSGWFNSGRRIVRGTATGVRHGTTARFRSRSLPSRNPRGLSVRSDRAVAVYDRR